MSMRFITRAIVVLLFVMMIVSSQTFSGQFTTSLGNALGLQNLGAKNISQVFGGGKATNIYDTALALARNNEVKISYSSIDAIMKIHPEFASCNISADDILNVLYDSNSNFRSILQLIVINASKKKVTVPSEANILNSYKRFLLCRKGQTDFVNVSDSIGVSNVLNGEYNNLLDANVNQNTIMQTNFGDDTFQNGTLDDSDYDLLVDIDQIGKKFFESFTTPAQTLFYELPTVSSLMGGSSIGSDSSSSSLPGGTFTVLSGLQTTGSATGSVPTGTSTIATNISFRTLKDPLATATVDPGIKDFINGNNNKPTPPNNLYALPASQCVSGIAADLTSPSNATLTVDQYDDYIQASIDALTATPELDNTPQVPAITSTTGGTTSTTYPSGTPNERVNAAMSGIGGTCGQTCNSLSEGERRNCITTCLKSCIAKCDDISITAMIDKAYCESQCLCFTVGGPVGDQWKGMEDMYKIKFCTIPVENNRVTGGKKVYSIEAIFQEIKNVFNSRLTSGEGIKRTKTKEFFDTSLSEIKFSDIFSFQITTQIKPLFPTISKTAQAKKLTQTNSDYESAILGMTPDDKNKYVIVADIAGNKVDAENVTDLDAYNQKIAELKNIDAMSQQVINNVIGNASNQNIAGLNDTVRNFMISNLNFRNTTYTTLQEINNLANQLDAGIQSKG